MGGKTVNSYDVAGNLSAVKDAMDGVTRYAYDILGRLTEATDPNGNTTRRFLRRKRQYNRNKRRAGQQQLFRL